MIARLLIFCISFARPFIGPAHCLFKETCTKYAIRILKKQSLIYALWCIVLRLLACSPFRYWLSSSFVID